MSSKHLVRAELAPGLELLPDLNLDAERLALFRKMGIPRPPPPDVPEVAVSERRAPGPPGAPDVRVLIYQPDTTPAPRPGILHIHGGGYVLGDADGSDGDNRRLARDVGCTIVSVDYRLAPETPHPGPVEDCYAALKWMHAHVGELGVDPTRLAVMGESAGGGLAAALALLARDRGEIPLIFQLLVYPMLDDRPPAEPHPYVGEFVWTAKSNDFGWRSLLGHEPGIDGVSPYAAAARAEDLTGLPAAFIATGALDLFLEENLEYARRLARAGVPTELHVYPGAYHGFQFVGDTTVSRRFRRDCRDALTDALRAP
jgi:acetyl esterase/lipase